MNKDKIVFLVGGPVNSSTASRVFSGGVTGGRIAFDKQIEEERVKEVREEYKKEYEAEYGLIEDPDLDRQIEEGEEDSIERESDKEAR